MPGLGGLALPKLPVDPKAALPPMPGLLGLTGPAAGPPKATLPIPGDGADPGAPSLPNLASDPKAAALAMMGKMPPMMPGLGGAPGSKAAMPGMLMAGSMPKMMGMPPLSNSEAFGAAMAKAP